MTVPDQHRLLISLDNLLRFVVCIDLKIKMFNYLSYHTVLEFKSNTLDKKQIFLKVMLHLFLF